jgi:hypothetical protein
MEGTRQCDQAVQQIFAKVLARQVSALVGHHSGEILFCRPFRKSIGQQQEAVSQAYG